MEAECRKKGDDKISTAFWYVRKSVNAKLYMEKLADEAVRKASFAITDDDY